MLTMIVLTPVCNLVYGELVMEKYCAKTFLLFDSFCFLTRMK